MSSFRSSITAGGNRSSRTPGSACSLPGGSSRSPRPRDCPGAWTAVAASSRRSVPSPSLKNRSWRGPLRSAGWPLPRPGSRSAHPSCARPATLCARRGRSAGSQRAPQSSPCSQAAPPCREMLESVVPELFGRAVFHVVRPGLGPPRSRRGVRFRRAGHTLRRTRSTRGTSPAVPDTGDQ